MATAATAADTHWLTTAAACQRVGGIGARTLKRWLAAGLPAYRPGGRKVLIDPAELDAWVRRARRTGRAQAAGEGEATR